MALTSIAITKDDKIIHRLQFYTEQHPTGLYVAVQACNEDWKPISKAVETTDDREESVYHKELREAAHKKNQFVPEYSTDPEWNPDYKPEENV